MEDTPIAVHGVTGLAFIGGLIHLPGGGTAQGGKRLEHPSGLQAGDELQVEKHVPVVPIVQAVPSYSDSIGTEDDGRFAVLKPPDDLDLWHPEARWNVTQSGATFCAKPLTACCALR